MNSIETSKQTMYIATNSFLDLHATVLSPINNYKTYSSLFKSAYTTFSGFAETQSYNRKGITIAKNDARDVLVIAVCENASRLVAYGRFVQNKEIETGMSLSLSKLKKLKDSELRNVAQNVYNAGQTNLTALTPYGTTATTQTAFLAVLTNYVTYLPKPRLSTAAKRQNTIALKDAFAKVDNTLADIDALIDTIRFSNPSLYNEYYLARKIILNNGTGLMMKGLVVDADTKKPIENAKIVLNIIPHPSMSKELLETKPIYKISAEKGGFKIKSLPVASYSVTVTKKGYVSQTITYEIDGEELNNLNITLVKV